MDRRGSQESDQQQQQQVQKRYQTLLPATESTPLSALSRKLLSDTHKLPPKRRLVLVACLRCRQKKEKCDGERPSCGRCISKNAECVYEVDDARTSRTSALKRKCDSLQDENDQLRELFGFLRQKPRTEAQDIFSRIRNSEEPALVLKSIKDAELLLPWSSPASGSGSASRSGSVSDTPRLTEPPPLGKPDAEALAESSIKVKAKPWTEVAGDGLVSNLISSFFARDNLILHAFIDKDCFLRDMAIGNPKAARYCSPFLVNAICTIQCFTSVCARVFDDLLGRDLKAGFLHEAKKQLALECGRSSLPTAQGLALLFSASIYMAVDRPNMSYRYWYCEMLRRLNLEARFDRFEAGLDQHAERRALARALWGFFIFESIVASGYLQLPSLPPPGVTRTSIESETNGPIVGEGLRDIPFGQNLDNDLAPSPPPAAIRGSFNAAADIAKLLYESMRHNVDHNFETGSADDLRARRGLYSRVLKLTRSLPHLTDAENELNAEACLLRVFINDVAISIIRPLRPGTIVEPSFDSVKELCIQHCKSTVDILDRYALSWPEEHTFMVAFGAYNVAFTLITLLNDHSTQDLLARCCEYIATTTKVFPVSGYILQALRALAWAMKVQIPAETRSILENTSDSFERKELQGVPIALVIPYHDCLEHLVPNGGNDWAVGASKGIELGLLLSRWTERCPGT